MSAPTPLVDGRLTVRTGLIVLAGFVVNLAFGRLTLLDAIKDVDLAILEAVVPWLQDLPGVTAVCRRLTDLGAIPINYLMAIVLAVSTGVKHRHLLPGILVFGTLFGSLVFQNATNRIVQGSVPAVDVIGGAGPYFSGGVTRVILLAGMAATVFLPWGKDRLVWQIAIWFGVLEAFTRLALGRHWPIDLVAAFPIALGLLWAFRQLYAPWAGASVTGDAVLEDKAQILG